MASNYSGMVSLDGPEYFVTRNDQHSSEKMMYKYKTIQVIISTSGLYRFECKMDDVSYLVSIGTIDLYTNSFDTTNVSKNRLTYKYGREGVHRNSFTVSLRPSNYILVVSLSDGFEKTFSILINGPASVTFS
jgi:hypothetical protein